MADDNKQENKKDLTGILEYSEALKESGQAPPIPEGSVMEDVPLEKIDSFESLEEYAVNNPAAATPEPSFKSTPPTGPSDPAPSFDSGMNSEVKSEIDSAVESGVEPVPEFQIDSPQMGSAEQDSAVPSFSAEGLPNTSDFPVTSTEEPAFSSQNSDFASFQDLGSQEPPSESPLLSVDAPGNDPVNMPSDAQGNDFLTSENPAKPEITQAPASAPSLRPEAGLETSPKNGPETGLKTEKTPDLAPTPAASSPSPAKPSTTLEKVKKFADNIPIGKSAVPASFPFSLLVTGFLTPAEKEKFLDVLSRENMGFREIDLEPQLASGRILIPRISEYAGILLVQALRSTQTQIKLGPSDTIFATSETRNETQADSAPESENEISSNSENPHPAEEIPVTSEDHLPGLPHYTLIDTLTASAALKSQVIEAESSPEYQEIIEALQRELKYKAYRKGATAVIHFKIQMNTLSSPTHYRILAMGSAIKPTSPTLELQPPPPSTETPPAL